MERLPSAARGGVPIEEHNPQVEIRKFAETNPDWDFKTEAANLYRLADIIVNRLYPVIHTPHFQGRLPAPLLAIEDLRNKKTLASYRIVPDGYGLNWKLTFNAVHYKDVKNEAGAKRKVWRYGEWALMETLVHELGHHWQQLLGDDPFEQTDRVTHNAEFRMKMLDFGIYCNSEGHHIKPAELDGVFGILMKEWGIKRPDEVPAQAIEEDWFKFVAKDKERKGRSTLTKYTCDCGQNIRVGKKEWPGAVCNACGSQYQSE